MKKDDNDKIVYNSVPYKRKKKTKQETQKRMEIGNYIFYVGKTGSGYLRVKKRCAHIPMARQVEFCTLFGREARKVSEGEGTIWVEKVHAFEASTWGKARSFNVCVKEILRGQEACWRQWGRPVDWRN